MLTPQFFFFCLFQINPTRQTHEQATKWELSWTTIVFEKLLTESEKYPVKHETVSDDDWTTTNTNNKWLHRLSTSADSLLTGGRGFSQTAPWLYAVFYPRGLIKPSRTTADSECPQTPFMAAWKTIRSFGHPVALQIIGLPKDNSS